MRENWDVTHSLSRNIRFLPSLRDKPKIQLQMISDPRKIVLLEKADNSTLRNSLRKRDVTFFSKAFSKAVRGSSRYTVITECDTTNDNLSVKKLRNSQEYRSKL